MTAGSYQAHLEEFRFGKLSGWAWNSADPDEAVQLDVVVNGTPVGQAVADRFRPDLAEAGIRNGYAGYSFALQRSSAARLPIDLEVRLAATGDVVGNGRVSLQSQYEGYVDSVQGLQVQGWAWNLFDPSESVQLAVFADDLLVGGCRADEFRSDLEAAGIGSGRHGFTFDFPPQFQGLAFRMRIEVQGSGFVLVGSDRDVQTRWEAALDDQVRHGRLSGWVRDEQTLAPVEVCLLVDGAPAACGEANLPHPDAAGDFGFDLKLPAAYLRPGTLNVGLCLRDTGTVVLAPRPVDILPAEVAFGVVEPLRADAIRGWAVNLADPDGVSRVAVDVDGMAAGVIECDKDRPDLVEPFGGHGRYGFEFPHRDEFFDGRRHIVRFVHESTGQELWGSPVILEPATLRELLLDAALAQVSSGS